MSTQIKQLETSLQSIRDTKPLILCLTNLVTMDFMANCLLAIGASPLMCCEESELEDLIKISHAVLINLGTLDDVFIARAFKAIHNAKQHLKPIILDPVGAGASQLRTNVARKLMPHVNIVRANASETIALVNNHMQTLGVDATASVEEAKQAADWIALEYGITVIVSGPEDYVSHRSQRTRIQAGTSLMTTVTGMGCAFSAVIAVFRAVLPAYESAILGSMYFGSCGAMAQLRSSLPGSFKVNFIDALYAAEINQLVKHARIIDEK